MMDIAKMRECYNYIRRFNYTCYLIVNSLNCDDEGIFDLGAVNSIYIYIRILSFNYYH